MGWRQLFHSLALISGGGFSFSGSRVWLESDGEWCSGEASSPQICGGGVASWLLYRSVPSGFGVLVLVLGSLGVWWCGGPNWLCLSEILLLVLSGGHGSGSVARLELSTELGDLLWQLVSSS